MSKKRKGKKLGRPSTYTPENKWPDKIKKYLEGCVDTQTKVGESAKGWPLMQKIVNLPTVEGLADFLDLSKETIYAWASEANAETGEKMEFVDAIRIIKARQAKQLINKGLSGEYNPLIAKLLLSANHGMAEETVTTMKVPPEKKEKIKKALEDF